MSIQSLLVRTDLVGCERAQSLGVAAEFMEALVVSAQVAIEQNDIGRGMTLLNLLSEQVIKVFVIAQRLDADETRRERRANNTPH